ncbi:hypothetical protein CW711_03835 [Candidatus Bathyarchaeota archaeon]|nr:MAG: hypothetical protein CW711_03835 [Candidatus Bathyarchaeota archaeon]
MSKIWEWIRSRRRALIKYEEAKEEFEKVIGRPTIRLAVELPPSLEDFKEEFQELEGDEEFMDALKRFLEKYLREKVSRAPKRRRRESEEAEASDEPL